MHRCRLEEHASKLFYAFIYITRSVGLEQSMLELGVTACQTSTNR